MMKNSKKISYLFAHGAGAPKNSVWMNSITKLIEKKSNHQIKVIRFNFPYMEKSQRENIKLPPDRMSKLLEHWEKMILKEFKTCDYLFIGGKSMGGRAATMIDFKNIEAKISGIINFGFPFHAPGKLPGDRIYHLENIKIPCLINQGEIDSMGTKLEISKYKLSKKIILKFLTDGNHDLKPRAKSGFTLEENQDIAVQNLIDFISKITKKNFNLP